MTAAVVRLRQGVRALVAFARPVDDALAAAQLAPAELALWRRLRRSEQQHSLRVLRALCAAGAVPPALAAAALLHDVGKTRVQTSIVAKSLPVLVRAVAPRLAARLGAETSAGWLSRAFVVLYQHPAWSAELMQAAGSDAAAVWLARHHADPPAAWAVHPLGGLLARLRAADDAN